MQIVLVKVLAEGEFSLLNDRSNRNIISVSVSFFNGISTFVGYLMPKLFSLKNSSDTI